MVNGSGKDGPKDSSQKDGSNDASRKRSSPVSEDQLKAMVSQQVQGALVNFLEQIGSQFQQVQGTLSALGDRLVGLEDLVQIIPRSCRDRFSHKMRKTCSEFRWGCRFERAQ